MTLVLWALVLITWSLDQSTYTTDVIGTFSSQAGCEETLKAMNIDPQASYQGFCVEAKYYQKGNRNVQ